MSEEADKLVEQGQMLMEKGDFKGASTKFGKAVNLDPDNAEAHFGKAEAAMGLPRLSLVDVAALYRKAIELAPENVFFLTSYGEFCLSHGLLPQAQQQYEKAAVVDPGNAHMYYSDLALGYFMNGLEFIDRQVDMSEEDITRAALGFYLKAFGVTEDEADAVLARVCEDEKRLTRPDSAAVEKELAEVKRTCAAEYDGLQEALGREPGNPLTLLSLGNLCIESGFVNAGMDFFGRAADMDGDNAPYFYNDLSTSLYGSVLNRGEAEGGDGVARPLCFALRALGNLEPRRAREILRPKE